MRAVLLILLLLGPAWAAYEGEVGPARDAYQGEVEFITDPPHMRVWLVKPEGLDFLQANAKGRVRLSTDHPTIVVQFGYDEPTPETHNVDVAQATRAQVWPPDRRPIPVTLGWSTRLRYELTERLFWLELAGLLLLAALALDRLLLAPRRRQLRADAEHGRKLAELKATLSDDDPLLLSLVNGYRLTGRLGAGGMATVYRGEKNGQAVAVKVIHRDSASDQEFRLRFGREVTVCARLSHPNIVRTLDAGDQDGLLYLVMELVDGHSLREEVRAGGLPPARVRELMLPVLDALAFAHAEGVIHRDLKPDNILLTSSGKPILMDFGLARRSDFQTVTMTGTVLGTPAYLAPEQISGGKLDERCDQYSIGIVLYELLAGQTPFPGVHDPVQLIVRHLSEPPVPLLEARPGLPPAWGALVMKMLEKNPDDRFPDIRAVRHALQSISSR